MLLPLLFLFPTPPHSYPEYPDQASTLRDPGPWNPLPHTSSGSIVPTFPPAIGPRCHVTKGEGNKEKGIFVFLP